MISKEELASTTPVIPPMVNKNTNPSLHNVGEVNEIKLPWIVANHLNTLIPVGMAIIIVIEVK